MSLEVNSLKVELIMETGIQRGRMTGTGVLILQLV
jgi:hypothetical protein